MSKTKGLEKEYIYDHIESFNKGHPGGGGVNSDFVSVIHWNVRVGGPTTTKSKLN